MSEVLLLTTAPSPPPLPPPPLLSRTTPPYQALPFFKTFHAPAYERQSQSGPLLLPNPRFRLLPALASTPNLHHASDLVVDGNGMAVDDVLREVDALLASSSATDFYTLLSEALLRFLRAGQLPAVAEVLNWVEKLGVCPLSLFDGAAMEILAKECCRLVDAGRVDEYVELVELLAGFGFSVKDFVKPFAVLRIFIEKRDPKMAVRYASILPRKEIMFGSIIQEFGKKRDLESALIAFNTLKVKLDAPNMYICRSIIDVCGSCGGFLISRAIFEELLAQNVTPNIYVFNSLMNVNAYDLSYTLQIYRRMQEIGVSADVASYNVLLKACCLARRIDLAQDIYREMKQMESIGVLKLDVFTYSTIIKVFADAKMWHMALKMKDDMLSAGVIPNVVTWSSLIGAFSNAGLVEQAIQVFGEMLHAGCEPNAQCCNILLNACVQSHQYDRAFRLFQSWVKDGFHKVHAQPLGGNSISCVNLEWKHGDKTSGLAQTVIKQHQPSTTMGVTFKPTVATYNILMKACGTDYHRAKALMDEMKTVGLCPNHITWSILIDICGRSHNMKGAMKAFNTMHDVGIKPDLVTFTAAIKACVQNKNLKVAFSLFEEMKKYGLKPNAVTYNTLLKARTKYGSLHEVQQCLAIYLDMRRAGYSSNDYFLKELVEEWCEGVIKDSERGLSGNTFNETNLCKSNGLLLKKLATILRRESLKGSLIDLQGLTKIEARIAVLAFLRMTRESYVEGLPVEHDMIIITGNKFQQLSSPNNEAEELQAALFKVLRNELDLDVVAEPEIDHFRYEEPVVVNSDTDRAILKKSGFSKKAKHGARRPLYLVRLLVPKKSLHDWLQKCVHHRK